MGFSPSLALYHLLGPAIARGRHNAPTRQIWDKRPPGRMIWLHAPRANDLGVFYELIGRMADQDPDLWCLLTTLGGKPDGLPDQCFHARLPMDTRSEIRAFLDHWYPDILIWGTGFLFPVLTNLASDRGIGLFLLDTGAAFEASVGWRLLPGLNRQAIRKFDTIFSGDEATSLALISAGAHSENVFTTGVIELGQEVLPCSGAEWETLAALFSTRPVWFAAEIDIEELGSVLAAHLQTLQRSHRLLLVVVPSDIDASNAFAQVMTEADIVFSRRSTGGEPSLTDQVYLADTEDEMGLWYRLAPVTFMGQTLAGTGPDGPNPFNAAALGSVVLHGPNIAAHRVAYMRLDRAGASREIAHMGELAHAVEALLSPDRAAIMAHAAWQISTAGAEVLEKTVERLTEVLALPRAPQ